MPWRLPRWPDADDRLLSAYNMPLHDLAVLVDAECYRPRIFRGPSVPSTHLLTAGLFGGFQGSFGIGVGDSLAGVFGLLYRPSGDPGWAVITR